MYLLYLTGYKDKAGGVLEVLDGSGRKGVTAQSIDKIPKPLDSK
jgi:hypothetical protein